MKVTIIAPISGTRDGNPWPAVGDTVVVPDDEGAQLCAAGLATPVAEQPSKKAEKRTPTRKSRKS